MQHSNRQQQKRIVERLSFSPTTAKRVRWEEWELTIVAPHTVAVTNASYGDAKADHTYTVTVAPAADDPDLLVPLHCTCPADQYTEDEACKHRVALAVCGGPVVLDAAMAFTRDHDETSRAKVGAP